MILWVIPVPLAREYSYNGKFVAERVNGLDNEAFPVSLTLPPEEIIRLYRIERMHDQRSDRSYLAWLLTRLGSGKRSWSCLDPSFKCKRDRIELCKQQVEDEDWSRL